MLKIYGAPPSIHTRKVVIAVLEKGLNYEFEFVFPFDPPVGWGELSPTGKIPALKDDDFHLADSSVIIAYLEKRFPRYSLYPADIREYARALWFEEYMDGTVAPDITTIFHQRIISPMLHKQPADEALVLDKLRKQLPPKFDYLEQSLQGDFLVGQDLSIADITVASNLMIYHYLGCTLERKRYPKLLAHFGRMLHRDSFKTALKAEQPFAEKIGLDAGFLQDVLKC